MRGNAYQVPPPPPWLLPPDAGREVEVVAVVGAALFASPAMLQKLVNQLWMLLKSLGFAAQAASQTPEVPVLNGARRASLQKQLS